MVSSNYFKGNVSYWSNFDYLHMTTAGSLLNCYQAYQKRLIRAVVSGLIAIGQDPTQLSALPCGMPLSHSPRLQELIGSGVPFHTHMNTNRPPAVTPTYYRQAQQANHPEAPDNLCVYAAWKYPVNCLVGPEGGRVSLYNITTIIILLPYTVAKDASIHLMAKPS